MSTPSTAIRFMPWKAGPDPATPTDGVDGLTLLLPVSEPVSVGAPPVRPDLVRTFAPGWESPIAKRTVSGHIVTRPACTAQRPTYRVAWTAIGQEDRDALLAWWTGTLGGTELSWNLEPDGADNGVVKVRFTSAMRETHVTRRRAVHVYTLEGDVEETF